MSLNYLCFLFLCYFREVQIDRWLLSGSASQVVWDGIKEYVIEVMADIYMVDVITKQSGNMKKFA